MLNRCAVRSDHYNAQVSWKYGTARAGLNVAHKKCEFCMFFAQNGCLTIITLLRGPNIIIWSHVLCQVHHPFKRNSLATEGEEWKGMQMNWMEWVKLKQTIHNHPRLVLHLAPRGKRRFTNENIVVSWELSIRRVRILGKWDYISGTSQWWRHARLPWQMCTTEQRNRSCAIWWNLHLENFSQQIHN